MAIRRFWLMSGSSLLFALLFGCSTSHRPDATTLDDLPECTTFLTALERCTKATGDPSVAAARVAQARQSILDQATASPAQLAATRRSCTDNVAQLARSCP